MAVKTTTTWSSLEDKKNQPAAQLRAAWMNDKINNGELLTLNPTSDDLISFHTWVNQDIADEYATYIQQTLSQLNVTPPTIISEVV